VALDSGGFSDNPTEEGLRRTRVLLDGMVKLGYRVVNVSERDLALGYDEFRKNVDGTGLKFVSANIVRQGTTERVFPPYEVLEVPTAKGKPLRVGIVGVTRFSPVWQKAGPSGTNLGLAPPAEMLAAILPEVRAKADVVVLLAALNREDAARLSRDLPGIDFVFGAYGGIYDTSFRKDGAPPVLFTGNQGRYTGEVRVFLDPARKVSDVQLYLHHLVARYPENPEMLAWVNARKAQHALRREAGTH
jgi:2',3'-cyclic-nucleotide 2'-phosphodiesterase (5'-nucleotidase family)